MPESDPLLDNKIPAGRLKAVLENMLHHRNIPKHLRPDFTNDAIITDEKVAFVREVLDTYEREIRDLFADDPEELERKISGINALVGLLLGGDSEELIARYRFQQYERGSINTSRHTILRVGGMAAKAWAREQMSGIIVGDSTESLDDEDEGTDELTPVMELGSEPPLVEERQVTGIYRDIYVTGFTSLRNTIIDLAEAGRLASSNAGTAHKAAGLFFLFGIDRPKSAMGITARSEARRDLHVRSAPYHKYEDTDQLPEDQDFSDGLRFISNLTTKEDKSPMSKDDRYPTVDSFSMAAMMMADNIKDIEEAKQFIQSRIAYVLDTLYPETSNGKDQQSAIIWPS